MIGTSSRKDDVLDRLSDGIAQLTNSDAWRTWLSIQARFHTYSFSNTVLILTQHPSATRVAGFATSRRLGRVVRRGEHAIWILAPVRRRAEHTDETEPEQSNRAVVAFRAAAILGSRRFLRGNPR